MGMHNAPRRVFSVGMIVCKSNFRELADNLQFAIDHDVGLNLSPVLLYPVTEQLNCFSDFESETAGWVETLDKAAAIAARAKAARRLAVGRVDPSGTIEELGLIFEQARAEYSVVAELECEIKDPHASLARMRRPALIAYDAGGVPRAYARLGAGVRTCVLKFPRCHIGEQPAVHINLVHDFLEPIGFLTTSVVPIGRSAARVNVPQFAGSTRPRNIHWANFGTSTPDGSNILDPKDIDSDLPQIIPRRAFPACRYQLTVPRFGPAGTRWCCFPGSGSQAPFALTMPQHNGTLLSDAVIDMLLRQHGTVMLSLDAVESKFHEVRREGVWSKAAPGLERLLRERDPRRLSIGVCPTWTTCTIR